MIKTRLNNKYWIAVVAVIAFGLGIAAMNYYYMYMRPTFRDLVIENYKIKQELSATKATRNKDIYRALVHRWNVVDLQDKNNKYSTLNKGVLFEGADNDFWFPIYMLRMKKVIEVQKDFSYDDHEIALNRGKLAVLLELVGDKEGAKYQWEVAMKLFKRKNIEEVKKFIYNEMVNDNSVDRIKYEDIFIK